MRRTVVLFTAMTVVLSSLIASASEPANDRGPSETAVDMAHVRLGEILARGGKAGQTCSFNDLRLSRRADANTVWNALAVNDNCELTLVATWEGDLGDGPDAMIEILETTESWPITVTEGTERGNPSSLDDEVVVAASSYCPPQE